MDNLKVDFMTVSAYMLFSIHLGKSSSVVKELRKIPQVIRVAVVTGEYDIIARITVENLEELYYITSKQIHMIEGIIEIQTAVIEKEELEE